ncbi:MAG: NUDIX domain-containing protein [Patescibacteria group bacterium]
MKKKTIKKVRAIIYYIKNRKPYFLILHRILRWRGWEFLKETVEKRETLKQAVLRGIKEETKLKNFKIIKRLDIKEKWQALGNNYSIVDTFLVRVNKNKKISLKQEIKEHDGYKWVNKKTALKKLTWPKTRKILKNINPHTLS